MWPGPAPLPLVRSHACPLCEVALHELVESAARHRGSRRARIKEFSAYGRSGSIDVELRRTWSEADGEEDEQTRINTLLGVIIFGWRQEDDVISVRCRGLPYEGGARAPGDR
jgi:hypothetical protein